LSNFIESSKLFINKKDMNLNIKDRFYIPQILPKDGSFNEFNLKRSVIAKVAITEKDREKYSIIEHKEDSRIEWDPKKDSENPLSVDFTKEEIEYLKRSCERLVDTAYPDEFWITVEKIYDTTVA
jgi:hypothetical protein